MKIEASSQRPQMRLTWAVLKDGALIARFGTERAALEYAMKFDGTLVPLWGWAS